MDGDNQVEVRMNGDATWMEVVTKFVDFLRGAGYSVTEEDVSQYLSPTKVQATGRDWEEVTISVTDPEYDFEPLNQVTTAWFNK